jgi:hypothetical protein
MSTSALNSPNNLQHTINDIYKLIGELRAKVER